MKKYETMTEIMEDTSLDLIEWDKAIHQFLKEKGMSIEEFMATEEGQRILEKRFEEPIM